MVATDATAKEIDDESKCWLNPISQNPGQFDEIVRWSLSQHQIDQNMKPKIG